MAHLAAGQNGSDFSLVKRRHAAVVEGKNVKKCNS